MDPVIAALATDVVVAWLAERTSPRDAMAAMPSLRGTPAAERAAVVRTSGAAIAGRRRFEFLLAGHQGLGDLPHRERARVLVLAAAVERGELGVAAAHQQAGREELDFGALRDGAAQLATTVDPVLRFGRTHSVPDWFAARALAQWGDEAAAVVGALGEPAPRTLRANLLRVADRQALAAELAAAGVVTTPGRWAATALHVDGETDLFATAAYARGAFEQQDEASQLVAAVVAAPPGGKVLDLCAGNGGKTLAIAAALQNRGTVCATDVHAGRLRALRERARRAGATNLAVHDLPEGDWPAAVATFAAHADRILIDAPCSGTGSWRRRPEARWGFDERALAAIVRTQDELLARAAAALRPGARLVYATCSVLASENEERWKS